MKVEKLDKNNILKRSDLKNFSIDIGGRDILIAFNEPAFRFSREDLLEGDIDSKLNARLVSYFLPAVEIARKQKRRPRMFIVSGLNMALKWNAKNEKQKKIMTIDNNLKMDFLREFFNKFFPNDFSIIEYVVAQDPIKIPEDKLLSLWKVLERRYPEQIAELKLTLAKYKKSRLFSNKELSEEALSFLNSNDIDLINAFKYAIAHIFALGDLNFEGNNIHNSIGYLTIGGPTEKPFNILRELSLKVLQDIAEIIFERDVLYLDNIKMIIENEKNNPVPYNGFFKSTSNKTELVEVTFENEEPLSLYDNHQKLKGDMEYLHTLISKNEYAEFWNGYKKRYFELKERYREAYDLKEDF